MHRSYSYAGYTKRAHFADKNEIYLATELFDAVEEHSLSDILMLLERDGANPNIVLPNKGIAPFHLVVGSENEEFAEEATRHFLQHDGNPNVKSDEGLTPVHVAAVWGRVRLLALLLACGGDPWVMDRECSQTPLQLAAQHHRWDAARLLERYQQLDHKSRTRFSSPKVTQPKFKLQLERVVVSNGELQAEYATTRGEAESNIIPKAKSTCEKKPILSPSRDRDNIVLRPWNQGDKVQQQEYVRQWCQNHQLSSPDCTPTRKVPESPKTPIVNVSGYSSVSTARADSSPKEIPKKMIRNGDVRRNLFLELKKRFSSPKSGHSSESETEKKSRKVFSRLIGKKKKGSSSGDETKKNSKLSVIDSSESSMVTESVSEPEKIQPVFDDTLLTEDGVVTTPENSPIDDDFASVIGTERFGTPLNSSLISEDVDEVDAIPLPSGSDTPVNCMPHIITPEVLTHKLLMTGRSGARSPDSVTSQMYFTCDEDTDPPMLAQALLSPQKGEVVPKSVTRSKSAPRLLRVGETPQKRIKTPAPQPPVLTNQSPKPVPPSPSTVPPSPTTVPLSPSTVPSSPRTVPQSPSTAPSSPATIPPSPSTVPPSPRTVPPSPRTVPPSPSTIPLSPISVPMLVPPPPPPPLPPPGTDEEVFKVPQRPPRRKQSLRVIASKDKENPPVSPDLEESLSKVFKPSIASSPCMQHAVLHYVPSASSSGSQSAASFVSVAEEYVYTDEEQGVSLVEKRLLAKPPSVPNLDESSVGSTLSGGDSDAVSDVSSLPPTFTYESDRLRKELESRGVAVGPITTTTKRVYLRQLYRLQKKGKQVVGRSPGDRVYCPEVERIFRMPEDWQFELAKYGSLEEAMCAPFDNPDPGRRWREGLNKSSFNYLLLDPRITQNLPRQLTCFNKGNIPMEAWRTFLSAIFYIGKGKRSRPYAHLYQAVRVWGKEDVSLKVGPKVARILDIWRSGQGVVCLHVYQNIIPVEAFTREAAMIDAIGIENVVNLKGGEYYGPAATWNMRQKRRLGIYLLYRALCVFVSEGERQLRPNDIS